MWTFCRYDVELEQRPKFVLEFTALSTRSEVG